MTRQQKAVNLLHRAYAAQSRGLLEEATRLLKTSLLFYPTAEAYTFLGWARSLEGDLEEAIALCRRAIQTDPEFGNPYSDIGAYLIQLHRFQEATAWLQKAVQARRYACYYSVHYNLGQIYEYLGDEPKAIEAYRLSLEHCPQCDQSLKAYWRLVSRTN